TSLTGSRLPPPDERAGRRAPTRPAGPRPGASGARPRRAPRRRGERSGNVAWSPSHGRTTKLSSGGAPVSVESQKRTCGPGLLRRLIWYGAVIVGGTPGGRTNRPAA